MKWPRMGIALITITACAALVLLGPTATARGPITVEVAKKATLSDMNRAVIVTVEVACAVGYEVLEAFVYVVQNGTQSQMAGLPVSCTHEPGVYTVRVAAYPDTAPFQPGEAQATTYVLLIDPVTGATISAGDSQRIKLR